MFKKIVQYSIIAFICFKFFTEADFGIVLPDKFTNLPTEKTAPECFEFLQNSEYSSAINCYKFRMQTDGIKPEYYYYMAVASVEDKNYLTAEYYLKYIVENFKKDKYYFASKRLLDEVEKIQNDKKQLDTTDFGDYYDELSNRHKFNKSPIAVYIQKTANNSNLRNAFNTWQGALYPVIAFQMTNSPENADIKVIYGDVKTACKNPKAVGCTNLIFDKNSNIIYSAVITLTNNSLSGKKFSNAQVYGVLVHEIGHAIGIGGHSSNKNDVMYPSTDNYNLRPTKRDKNTVTRIYEGEN